MRSEPNTEKWRPSGAGWVFLVRKKRPAPRSSGAWYLSTAPAPWTGDVRERAIRLAEWLETQADAGSESDGWNPFDCRSFLYLGLWFRTPSRLSEYQRPAVWRAVRDACVAAKAEAPGAESPVTSKLYGVRVREYDPSWGEPGREDVWAARFAYRPEVELDYLGVPIDLSALQLTRDRVRQELGGEPPPPDLDTGVLPSPPDDRASRTTRRLDASGLSDFFDEMIGRAAPWHDGAVMVVQAYLDRLVGRACPAIEDNHRMIRTLMEQAELLGVRFFCHDGDGHLHEVRVKVSKAARAKPDTPLGMAGRFTVHTLGRGGTSLFDSATVPALIAARDLAQATAFAAANKSDPND